MTNRTNAYTEVYVVLQDLIAEDYNKIPSEVIEVIEENRNKGYVFELDYNLKLKEQELLPETKAILFNLFRDYLATPMQREKIKRVQAEERVKNEQKKIEDYDVDVFTNDNNDIIEKKPGIIINSKLIKATMGFDEFPVNDDSKVSYNLMLDGSKLSENKAFVLENEELENFLSDLQNIENNCDISGVNIKNVIINDKVNLRVLANIVRNVRRINIENSSIPGLADWIRRIEKKECVELINITDSNLNAKDIDSSEFKNIYSFSIENTISTVPALRVAYPWYKRLLNKIKKWPVFGYMFR